MMNATNRATPFNCERAVAFSLRAVIAAALIGAPLLAAAGTWQTLKNPPPIGEVIDPARQRLRSRRAFGTPADDGRRRARSKCVFW